MTGLIWLAIVAGWLAYLVPRFLLHKESTVTPNLSAVRDALAAPMHIVRRGGEDDFAEPSDPGLEISTPLQRDYVLFQTKRAAQIAMRRRRTGFIGSVIVMIAGVVVSIVTPAPWWLSLVGIGVLVVFVVLSRVSVHTVNAMISDQLDMADQDWAEETVMVREVDLTHVHDENTEISIPLNLPVDSTIGDLWEPIAVTPPTYVSKPLVPRSVRTIDLSMTADPPAQPKMPVTAEAPQTDRGQDGQLGQIRHGHSGSADRNERRGDEGDLPKAVGE